MSRNYDLKLFLSCTISTLYSKSSLMSFSTKFQLNTEKLYAPSETSMN